MQRLTSAAKAVRVSRHVISLDSRDQRKNVVGSTKSLVAKSDSEFGISAANLQRAHGGCLGVKSEKGVEVCEKPGEVDKQVMIPGFPTATS